MASNTKDYILEVALDMFSQYGYAGTKLSELATRVGITKAALYKHYKSKEDIWLSAIAMFDGYYKALTATPEHKPTVPDSFEAFKAQERLKGKGIDVSILSLTKIKPIDNKCFDIALKYKKILPWQFIKTLF